MPKQYCVYIMTNKWHSVFYTGITSDLAKRVYEHKTKVVPGFTSQYRLNELFYYEVCDNPEQAILREKQIKGGSRAKKIALIKKMNPQWKNLSDTL